MAQRQVLYLAMTIMAISIAGFDTFFHTQRLSYGFKGGETASYIAGLEKLSKQSESSKSPEINPVDVVRSSLHGGIYASSLVNSQFSLHSEIIYTKLGIQKLEDLIEIKGQYLNIPVYGVFYPWGTKKIGGYLGMSFNYCLKEEVITIPLGSDEHFRALDIAIVGGLKYSLTNDMGIDIRLGHGVTNIFKDNPKGRGPLLKNISLFNRYLKVSLDYNVAPLLNKIIKHKASSLSSFDPIFRRLTA